MDVPGLPVTPLPSGDRATCLTIHRIGGASPESRARATSLGATAYYTKPFSPIALLKEIDSIKGQLAERRASK